MTGIESRVICAANTLIEAKKAPDSNAHINALSRLTDLVAKNPDMIGILSKLQKEK